MNTTSHPAVVATGRAAASTHVGARLVDVAVVSWRQHRLAIVVTGLAVGALAGWMLSLSRQFATLVEGCAAACPAGTEDRYYQLKSTAGPLLSFPMLALPVVLATFWAAPMIAREYEQRTHLLAWSQDVSPARWVLGKVSFLGAVALLLSFVHYAAVTALASQITSTHRAVSADPAIRNSIGSKGPFDEWSSVGFELSPWLLLAHTACVFALGLAFSVLTRSTLVAVALTAVSSIAVHITLMGLRTRYLPAIRQTWPLHADPGQGFAPGYAVDGRTVGGGFLDAGGNVVEQPIRCYQQFDQAGVSESWPDCAKRNGIVTEYLDYIPNSAVPTIRLIEVGIYTVLAALALVVVWRRVRRMAVL